MAGKRKSTDDALEIIDREIIGDDEEMRARVEEETLNARVASLIYDARTEAGLSQREFAKLVGTSQPAIARLENADYEGHSLAMLQRIARALGRRVEVKLPKVA